MLTSSDQHVRLRSQRSAAHAARRAPRLPRLRSWNYRPAPGPAMATVLSACRAVWPRPKFRGQHGDHPVPGNPTSCADRQATGIPRPDPRTRQAVADQAVRPRPAGRRPARDRSPACRKEADHRAHKIAGLLLRTSARQPGSQPVRGYLRLTDAGAGIDYLVGELARFRVGTERMLSLCPHRGPDQRILPGCGECTPVKVRCARPVAPRLAGDNPIGFSCCGEPRHGCLVPVGQDKGSRAEDLTNRYHRSRARSLDVW